jgi:hypothetical protein
MRRGGVRGRTGWAHECEGEGEGEHENEHEHEHEHEHGHEHEHENGHGQVHGARFGRRGNGWSGAEGGRRLHSRRQGAGCGVRTNRGGADGRLERWHR